MGWDGMENDDAELVMQKTGSESSRCNEGAHSSVFLLVLGVSLDPRGSRSALSAGKAGLYCH